MPDYPPPYHGRATKYACAMDKANPHDGSGSGVEDHPNVDRDDEGFIDLVEDLADEHEARRSLPRPNRASPETIEWTVLSTITRVLHEVRASTWLQALERWIESEGVEVLPGERHGYDVLAGAPAKDDTLEHYLGVLGSAQAKERIILVPTRALEGRAE